MANEYNRNQRDASALTTISKALAAATVTNRSDSFDLGPGAHSPENFEVEISIPAMPLHVTANNVTITLHDSADNSSFAATDPVVSTTILGVVTDGSAAKTIRFRLPANIRRYFAFSQVSGATDTLTTYSITYTLLF